MIKIEDKSKCCGCSACFDICSQNCIKMVEDEEGFVYPLIDNDKCINCNLCEKVCPVINKNNKIEIMEAYACYNKNEEIRLQSSSGGIFTLLAENIILQNE